MKKTLFCLSAAAMLLVLSAAAPAHAQRSYDDRIDIARLLADAGRPFDLASQDVVILSDGQSVTRFADGRYATTVHRILWINSYLAVDDCGDVRVPFDSDHCTFTTLAVRSWRDGQWWPSDSSGVVETLPFEVEKAYDYAGMREVMLLLSGMGVPCIIEVAYRIEDRTPFRADRDGLWLFARPDPAVESWFEFCAPAGAEPRVAVTGGDVTPVRSSDPQTGLEKTRWTMTNLGAQPDLHAVDPAADSPHLIWSTWKSWQDLGKMVTGVLNAGLASDSPLGTAIDSLSREARTVGEKAKMIAEYVSDRVTYVDYPESWWWANPREAERVSATAYGHRLDRAILAAALFRRAGLQAEPMFASKSLAPLEAGVASLVRLNGVSLHIQGEGLSAVYDPSDGTLSPDPSGLSGRTTWIPSAGSDPLAPKPVSGDLKVRLDLKLDEEKSKWVGSGLFAARGGLSPFDQMNGLDGAGEEYLGSVVESLIKNVSVDDYSPEQFDAAGVAAGFTLTLDSAEVDDFERTVFAIGEPKGGIIDHVSGQAELFRRELHPTIYLAGPMSQRVECRIDTTGCRIVYRPDDFTLTNAAGTLAVTTTVDHGRLIVARELRLARTVYAPSDWPALRELLLAESQPGFGLVMLKRVDSD